MNADRELLELAAKAAGYVPATQDSGSPFVIFDGDDARGWNPLDDDGDALRLAVKAGIRFCGEWSGKCYAVFAFTDYSEESGSNAYAATRRAIVRAAAEIGKAMP